MPREPRLSAILPEDWLQETVLLLVRVVESAGALVIFIGALVGFVRFGQAHYARRARPFTQIRLDLGRYLSVGLEFQLASDLLRTAVAPTFDQIGKLAAVAAIRTALNFFLSREVRSEREEVVASSADEP